MAPRKRRTQKRGKSSAAQPPPDSKRQKQSHGNDDVQPPAPNHDNIGAIVHDNQPRAVDEFAQNNVPGIAQQEPVVNVQDDENEMVSILDGLCDNNDPEALRRFLAVVSPAAIAPSEAVVGGGAVRRLIPDADNVPILVQQQHVYDPNDQIIQPNDDDLILADRNYGLFFDGDGDAFFLEMLFGDEP
jgi:hypothetical protein